MKSLIFTLCGRNDMHELRLFIRRNQKFAVALCSRFEEMEKSHDESFNKAAKHFYIMRMKETILDKGRIHGFFYAQKDVLMLHLFDKAFLKELESNSDLAAEFSRRIRDIVPSVYGVAGVSVATTLIAEGIGLQNSPYDYLLMEFSPEKTLQLNLPPDFVVKKCRF